MLKYLIILSLIPLIQDANEGYHMDISNVSYSMDDGLILYVNFSSIKRSEFSSCTVWIDFDCNNRTGDIVNDIGADYNILTYWFLEGDELKLHSDLYVYEGRWKFLEEIECHETKNGFIIKIPVKYVNESMRIVFSTFYLQGLDTDVAPDFGHIDLKLTSVTTTTLTTATSTTTTVTTTVTTTTATITTSTVTETPGFGALILAIILALRSRPSQP